MVGFFLLKLSIKYTIIPRVSNEIHFVEPQDEPRPKEDIGIRALAARPYTDGRRVQLAVRLTPFLERPNLEFEVFNALGASVGQVAVIESMEYEFELTLHLRGPTPSGEHTLRATVLYPDGPPPVSAETKFVVTPPGA
jgi:hypothetical protein